MRKATSNLEDDHVHILRLIDVMEHISGSENPDISHLEKIVDIIRNFADGLHHAKEENLFFPFLGQRGFSSTQGPVAVMIHEHVIGRNFVKGMADSISLYKAGNKKGLSDIYINMSGYAELLRSHISKENTILFRMADKVLSESDHSDLLASFEEAEKVLNSRGSASEYTKQIKELTDFYNLS